MSRVVVIGGGPAGAMCAAILAREGLDVTIVERDDFPRHHVGEALQPAAIELLDTHLGIGEAIASAGFSIKYGALYEWGVSNERWSVLFDDKIDEDLPNLNTEQLLAGSYDHSWHVDRARFDKLILDEAVRSGAKLLLGEALKPEMRGKRVVGLHVRDRDGVERLLPADQVVDCSGQRCFLGRRFGLVRNQPDLQATAIYGYFDGCDGLEGALHRYATLVVSVPEGWVWFIPQSLATTSIGLITADKARYTEEQFLEVLERANIPFGAGTPVREEDGSFVRHARDWSYVLDAVAGPGWILAGDSAGFVDPILAGGVEFAVRGACNAALATAKILSDDGWEPTAVADDYARNLRLEQAAYLKLARYWYGNNRSVEGFFWEAHRAIQADALSLETPLRAFKYLTTGRLDADRHYKVFIEWQERKMFQRLGVDKTALKAAIARARSRIHMPA